MDHRQLQFLDALAREHHFGRAAKRCQVTQPTLSARIKQLELELGYPLVKRGKYFERFTPEGNRILEHARRILREYAALTGSLTSSFECSGPLTIGTIPSAMADVIQWSHHSAEVTTLELREYSMSALLLALEQRTVDLGIGYIEATHALSEEFVIRPLLTERMMIFYSSTHHELPDVVQWKMLENYPHGVLSSDMQRQRWISCIQDQLTMDIRINVEADSVMTLLLMVAQGRCIAVLPQGFSGVAATLSNVVAQHLPDMGVEFPRVGAIWQRGNVSAPLIERMMKP
ncbi:Hydrogen peroxide-inducible genes activator [Halomonadaceae bacterium LMG 33818]|uniref:LysR family transcriptional regulator n=1 Tax=Cernens ardua TaxID=3402176 RepID=UPI003EDC587E